MISVIIPVLNERSNIIRLLDTLASDPAEHEVIVVDGGSEDGTARAAQDRGANVHHTTPGRGQQLALGGKQATGDILLFLHADSHPPRGALSRIRSVLDADPALVGGNFRVVFDGDTGFARWLTGFYAWFRRKGLYYGDSGIFARRVVYERIGGIRPIALMEDYDFSRRLEQAGETCCIMEPALITSSRKFTGRHPVAIFLGWIRIHALYYIGMSPDRLARIYYRQSG